MCHNYIIQLLALLVPRKIMNHDEILTHLQQLGNTEAIAGMARFGITPQQTFGINIPTLRQLARQIGKNHALAQQLWADNYRETRILAGMVADPRQLSEVQMEQWAADFDYWEICDQVVSNLFERTPLAYPKAIAWSSRPEEYVKRAGFVLMARLAVSDKKATNSQLAQFFPLILRETGDSREMVKKAINWALRQIGKRNHPLNLEAIAVAQQMLALNIPSGNWIARDALRELQSAPVQSRLKEQVNLS